jgi:hypothetical protein
MSNIAQQRIQREFREVIKSEEVRAEKLSRNWSQSYDRELQRQRCENLQRC